MKLNKENLLNYYEMKKASIEEMRDKTTDVSVINGWNNQLNLIEALILELDLFD